jgi:methionine synthase II (cobalamin-independent)
MRTACKTLGSHLHGVTDGETGARTLWIAWQLRGLSEIDGIEIAAVNKEAKRAERPALVIDPSLTELPARSLGYADAAEESYKVFLRLREEGAIPEGVKFQVSVPTPYAAVVTFVRKEDQARFFPIYADAIEREVNDIASIVDEKDLMIQHDVAVEIGVLTGAFEASDELSKKDFIFETVERAMATPDNGAERGMHLCYGDYGHKHFTVPEDLSLCVEIANATGKRAEFIHMPADRETGRNASYFEPLRDLTTTGRLALGVIDYEGDEERTRELLDAATTGTGGKMKFEVATECGMSRIDMREDAPTLEHLLELHARFADPVR